MATPSKPKHGVVPPPPNHSGVAPPPSVAPVIPPPPKRPTVTPAPKLHPDRLATFDIEIYWNYLLITIVEIKPDGTAGGIIEIEQIDNTSYLNGAVVNRAICKVKLFEILSEYTMVSFNGIKFDNLVLTGYMNDLQTYDLKSLCNMIINERLMPWTFERRFGYKLLDYDHIDLIEVAFGTGSLKLYGARLESKRLQELPIHENSLIGPSARAQLRQYCINDNTVTRELYNECKPAIRLREYLGEKYNTDFRSKSDAQIGEAILAIEAERKTGVQLRKPNVKTMPRLFKYTAPDFVQFTTPVMQSLKDLCTSTEFKISTSTNKVTLPKEISKVVTLGDGDLEVGYKMGIGGLHSVTKTSYYECKDDEEIFEIDASSFYPNIILNGRFHIPSIGESDFHDIYSRILDEKNRASARLSDVEKRLAELKAML